MLLGVGVLCEHVFLQQDDECHLVWVCCVNMCFCSRVMSATWCGRVVSTCVFAAE